MKITAEPRSDQWNAEDFIAGSRIFAIDHVIPGKAEQKYDIVLQGEQRVWRPPLTVLRTLIACWGDDSTQWHGRHVELYTDPTVTFGKSKVGGIRLQAVSHIDAPVEVMVTESRGRRAKVTVQVLQPPAQQSDVPALIEACAGDTESLRRLWTDMRDKGAPEDVLNLIANAVPPQTMTEQPELGEQE